MDHATRTPTRDARNLATTLVVALGLGAGLGCDPGPQRPFARGTDAGPPAEVADAGAPRPAADPDEPCGDGLDGDADGAIDEGCMCEVGERQRCFVGDPALAGVGACAWGEQACASDFEFGAWDACLGSGEPSEERCDRVDNDCDGTVDEGCECVTGEEQTCYSGPPGTAGVGICAEGRRACEMTASGSAWGACVGEVLPETEVCDGLLDEDCDGQVDEGCDCVVGDTRDCYPGTSATLGVGLCAAGRQRCEAGPGGVAAWGACAGATTPTAEACTGGADEDCDGLVDCADLADCETDPACCTPLRETVPIVPPDGEILFVVDRSGSMDWPAAGSTRTRWEELTRAMTTVLPSLAHLPLGMLTFPEQDGTSERYNCAVAPGPDVPLGVGNGGAIGARLLFADPRAGDTPTPGAFATVERYLAAHPSSRPRFVVLATDGLPEPNCGATVSATASAIRDLRLRHGVETFVLGIVGPTRSGDTSGIPALRSALNLMADAGGRPRPGSTRFYEATDGPALTTSLQSIIAAAADCHVDLATAPARPAALEVRQNGVRVSAGGWTLAGRQLTFHGAYCDAIRTGVVTSIEVIDSCTP